LPALEENHITRPRPSAGKIKTQNNFIEKAIMKTILAATDFSNVSVNAVNYAADLSVAVNARLVLFHVFHIPLTMSDVAMPEPVFEEMTDDINQNLEKLNKALMQRTKGKIPIAIDVEFGTAEYRLSEYCKNENPFAVVMGLESSTSLERFFMGSKTSFAISSLTCPVLIVPDHAAFAPIEKVGLACDLRNVKSLPFEKIIEWLTIFKPGLEIIHVSKTEQIKPGETNELISLYNKLNKFRPAFHYVAGENIQEKIDQITKVHRLDLLIVVPKKHGIDEIFNRKHARRIAAAQHIPVLSVHEA
jgi:nucleotide-binding universal stress UspA family protein